MPSSNAIIRRTSVLFLSALLGCTEGPAPQEQAAAPTPRSTSVTIMTFNVENLFDSADDPGKDDSAYLPAEAKQGRAHVDTCERIEVEAWRNECLYLDWDDEAVEFKLGQLADTIRQVGDHRGPDIIALQEVENLSILERLRSAHLADLGYGPAILIEGSDGRGIDVAFLSRLPLTAPARLHPIEFVEFAERGADTQGVLEATFELPDGSLLTGYSVHFPAPYHPTEMRVDAYNHLTRLREALPDDRPVFAAGDFNTTSSEDAGKGMLDRFVRPLWTVAHETGCDGCRGTSYYARDDSWSFLDMILWAPPRTSPASWAIRPESVRIANAYPPQVSEAGTPARFHLAERSGVSHHWPLVATIERIHER